MKSISNLSQFTKEEFYSDKHLNCELAGCGYSFAVTSLPCCLLGLVGYPLLVNRFLSKYAGYEARFLIASVCVLATTFVPGYFAKKNCEENVKKFFAEKREKLLEDRTKN